METKFCRKCNSYLDINLFHKSKSKSYPDGHISTCKKCIKNRIIKPKETSDFVIKKGNFIISFE